MRKRLFAVLLLVIAISSLPSCGTTGRSHPEVSVEKYDRYTPAFRTHQHKHRVKFFWNFGKEKK